VYKAWERGESVVKGDRIFGYCSKERKKGRKVGLGMGRSAGGKEGKEDEDLRQGS
jgi:hypothetical protein